MATCRRGGDSRRSGIPDQQLQQVKLMLLIGSYAQQHYLAQRPACG
jgi:hypothetical protein